jgi:hypothetical protein
MNINATKAVSFSLLLFGITAGSAVYALGKGNSAQPSGLPPTPPPLLNLPTVPPPTLQNAGLGDFLDHSIPAGFGMIKGKVIDDSTGTALGDAHETLHSMPSRLAQYQAQNWMSRLRHKRRDMASIPWSMLVLSRRIPQRYC